MLLHIYRLNPSHPRPFAAVETKGALEDGNARFDAGTEVSKFLVDPLTLGHLQDRQPTLLGKDGILHTRSLGKGKIVL